MRSIGWSAMLLTLAGLLACNSGQKSNVSVSLKTAPTAQASTGGADLKNGIVLTEVRMVVRKITLFPAPSAAATPTTTASDADVPDADDKDELPRSSFGPFAVDALGSSLAGGIHPVFDADVDKGTYAGGLVVVSTLRKDSQATDPVLSAMKALHASIAIDGTIDGQAFEFQTPMRVAQWKQGPIVVGDGTTNLTLDVDPTGWFTAPDATTRLDPRSSTDRGEILENIRCSIRLFKDDDHDGKPDDGDEDWPEGCGGHHHGD
jgi:hypothetical protein